MFRSHRSSDLSLPSGGPGGGEGCVGVVSDCPRLESTEVRRSGGSGPSGLRLCKIKSSTKDEQPLYSKDFNERDGSPPSTVSTRPQRHHGGGGVWVGGEVQVLPNSPHSPVCPLGVRDEEYKGVHDPRSLPPEDLTGDERKGRTTVSGSQTIYFNDETVTTVVGVINKTRPKYVHGSRDVSRRAHVTT